MTETKPIGQKERIDNLDIMRGFAIFGILMVNMHLFYKPITAILLPADTSQDAIMLAGDIFIKLFFEGKFYVLFSFLFGYGFWLFINKSSSNGTSIIPIFRRRLFILLLFGVLHVVLLWAGDILLYYALFGFLMLLFRRKTNRSLIKWAIAFASIPIIFSLLGWLGVALASLNPDAYEAMVSSIEGGNYFIKQFYISTKEVYTSGSFKEIVSARLAEYKMILPGIIVFYPMVIAMFLVGTWAARLNLLANVEQNMPFFRKLFKWGVFVGIPSTILYALGWVKASSGIPNGWIVLSTAMAIISGVTLCGLYVSSILLLINQGKLNWFKKYITPVGRMALTNYLMHSIICTTLFLSYGFGLTDKINVWQGMLIVLAIYAVQIPLSYYWLQKFNFGPFEWLWRSLTYLKVQPFRKPVNNS